MYNRLGCFFIHVLKGVYFSEGQTFCARILTFFMAVLAQAVDRQNYLTFRILGERFRIYLPMVDNLMKAF